MTSHKPALLLLHGALGCKDQFDPLIKLLNKDFEILTLNFSGHGDNPNVPERFTLPLFTQDVLDFLKQGLHATVDIFGYSMGGYVALNLAKEHPAIVGKIMTLATKFNWTPESGVQEGKMLDAHKIEEKVPAFAQILKTRHTAMGWQSVLAKTAGMMKDLGNGQRLEARDLNAVQSAVMVLRGTWDRMVTEEESVYTANTLAKGQFKPLPDAEHPLEKIDPISLSALITDYFKA